MRPYPTASRTGRFIRIPSTLGRAFDHRHSQAESEFRTDHDSRVDLQRYECYRVHVRVSCTTGLPFFHIFSLILVKRQQGQGRKGEVGQRCGVEHGARRYWGSDSYGSGQEERWKGFRVSLVVVMPIQPMALTVFTLERVDTFYLFYCATTHGTPPDTVEEGMSIIA